ncbi:hypothetical protein FGSG_07619 [Fusarium graminearum PH-1]|uniref:hypothetical protein n=1 Tax=Gibberella zeae (strain ATCC MYA-4620 / CBS 123657 / FGSC 9075 / NRRL 31084 / PH-1) TaxID=229533 RepID=UPI00021F25D9|nr:hypothetical protein FGSG_07619 [Fusarium graminearum PH-1]ESU13898.1 hypothetical protein FGSG_07619 [Fusarium graminearum PH-1]|eukprot:XP_011327405.1 hypothetical protein FGSG_07619 [Fusarium graminearum PH-1]
MPKDMSSSTESVAVTNNESPTAMATPPVAECDMCSKIIQVFSGPIYPGTEDKPIQVVKLGNVGELLAVNCPHANWLRDIEYLNGPIPRYETHGLLFHRWAKDQQGSMEVGWTWTSSKNGRPGATSSMENARKQGPELTGVLGVRWLWVDSLCIPQDDDEVLKRELAAMHRIYATSFLTIVAADGGDAEYGLRGLRGISKPRAIKQMIEPLSQGEKVVFWPWNKSNDQVEYGLRYRHRMWTSQEYHFSKRRLIFENGQATWQCNHTEWTEDHVYNPEHEKLQKKPPESYIGHDAYLKLPSLNRLSALVEIFNTKTLRYGEDVYNAFSGYNAHLNSIFPHGLVYGLPQLFFDIALCWKPSGLVQRRTVSARYTGDPLRTGLPSWSWMGWKGQTNFPGDVEGEIDVFSETGFTEAITDWYAMEFPGSYQKQPIHSRWSHCRNAPPGSLAELWRCEEFKPPAMYDTRSDSNLDDADSMPKELPGHIYHAHLGDNPIPATRWRLPASRWYPIPLNSDESDTSQAELHNEFQYLWCQTHRAYFTITQDIVLLRRLSK